MIFLPIAFYCTITSVCVFSQGLLTTDLELCTAQNQRVEQQFKADGNIHAFQTTCAVIKPNDAQGTDI